MPTNCTTKDQSRHGVTLHRGNNDWQYPKHPKERSDLEKLLRLARQTGMLALLTLSSMSLAAQITITEVTQQEFPAVYTSNKTGSIVMNWDSSIKSIRNLNLFGGFYSSAEFLIESDTNQRITIDVIPNSIPGVQITVKEMRYQNKVYRKIPVTRVGNPGNGSSLFIGMEVSIDPNIAPKEKLAVSYELIVTEL